MAEIADAQIGLPFHELTNTFKMMEGVELEALALSIQHDGLLEPIVLYEGAILDGRARYRACQMIGVSPMYRQYNEEKEGDPERFVIAQNIMRRNLSISQRAMIVAQLGTLKKGENIQLYFQQNPGTGQAGRPRPAIKIPPSSITVPDAAALGGVHKTTLNEAKRIVREGTAEDIEAVLSGQRTVNAIVSYIKGRVSLEERKRLEALGISKRGRNPEKYQQQQMRGKIWAQLRDALVNLTSLPLPSDVVKIARNYDKTSTVDERLLSALDYLREFADLWTTKKDDEVG